jgi:hypothetical protein
VALIFRRGLWALLLASLLPAQAQLRGRFAATDGSRTVSGTWTADLQTEADFSTGTWTLKNASGNTVARGTWAARKAGNAWRGVWQARAADRRTFSGTWTAQTKLPASSEFTDLLTLALTELVTGTWRTGNLSGAWSIRADAAR